MIAILIILLISILLFLLYVWSITKRNKILQDKDLIRYVDMMTNTCVYKGIATNITIIPDIGDMWLDVSRDGVVIGDGKTPLKDLPIIERKMENKDVGN